MELMSCPSLAVPNEVMHHVVRVESSYNPYAIGVVGGRLVRQPRNLSEALSTVRMLESRGFNFSLGLAQVNRYNLAKYGLDSYEKAFQACPNLQAGSKILAECYGRSKGDWGKSFSCYYSGNFVTGFRQGYVQKVFASISEGASSTDVSPIEVISKPQRRSAPIARHPVYRTLSSPQSARAEGAVSRIEASQAPVQVQAAAITTPPPVVVQPVVPPAATVPPANPDQPMGDQAFVF